MVIFVLICVCVIIFSIYLIAISEEAKAKAKRVTENLIAENELTITTQIDTFFLDENKKCWTVKGIDYLFKYDDIIDFKYDEIGGQIAKASATGRALYGTAVTTQFRVCPL